MKILVISPRPDDETLGCGGTILKHKDIGDKIYWLIITNIDEKNRWEKETEKETVDKRQEEIKIVAEMYDFEKTFKLNCLTSKLHIVLKNFSLIIFKNISKYIKSILIIYNLKLR